MRTLPSWTYCKQENIFLKKICQIHIFWMHVYCWMAKQTLFRFSICTEDQVDAWKGHLTRMHSMPGSTTAPLSCFNGPGNSKFSYWEDSLLLSFSLSWSLGKTWRRAKSESVFFSRRGSSDIFSSVLQSAVFVWRRGGGVGCDSEGPVQFAPSWLTAAPLTHPIIFILSLSKGSHCSFPLSLGVRFSILLPGERIEHPSSLLPRTPDSSPIIFIPINSITFSCQSFPSDANSLTLLAGKRGSVKRSTWRSSKSKESDLSVPLQSSWVEFSSTSITRLKFNWGGSFGVRRHDSLLKACAVPHQDRHLKHLLCRQLVSEGDDFWLRKPTSRSSMLTLGLGSMILSVWYLFACSSSSSSLIYST